MEDILNKIGELKNELHHLALNRDYAPSFKYNIKQVRLLVSEIEEMVNEKKGGIEHSET